MKNIILISFIILGLLTSQINTAEYIYEEPIQVIREFQQLHPAILGNLDYTATLIFDSPDCERCRQIENVIQEYAENNEGFTQTMVIDCEAAWQNPSSRQNLPMCEPDFSSQLPVITMFQPPQYKAIGSTDEKSEQFNYAGPVTSKDMGNFLRKHMNAYRYKIKSASDYEEFLNTPEYENKVLLISHKEKTSPTFKAITTIFRGRLLFAEVHESVKEVVDLFDDSEVPALYVLQKEEDGSHTPIVYDGAQKFENIRDFLEEYKSEKNIGNLSKMRDYENKNKSSKSDSSSKKSSSDKKEKESQSITINQLEIDNVQKQIFDNEKPVLVHIKDGDSVHASWKEVFTKYQFLFDYYEFDANTEENKAFAKETLKAKTYPGIRFFPPGTAKKPYSTFNFGPKDTDMKEIHAEVLYQIPDHTISVNDEQNLQMQFQYQLQGSKIALLYFYDKEVSLGLRVAALQSEYQKKFGFISYKDPSQMIKEQFGVQKLPAMIALFREADLKEKSAINNEDDGPQEGEEVKVAQFSGKFNYLEISNFLNVWIQAKEGNLGGPSKKKDIVEISSMEDFATVCEGSNQCFVAILNGENSLRDDKNSKFHEQMAVLQKIGERYARKSINIGWIDGVCHSEILYPFDMSDDQIPNFISYSHSKKQISKMIGTFDRESLAIFIEKVLNYKVSQQPLQDTLKIREYNCVEQHEIILKRKQELLNQDDEEDEIMREMRLEREQREREQREEAEQKKDKKKKKKKKGKKQDL